eukprot:1598589-Rhodomonas_salina.3
MEGRRDGEEPGVCAVSFSKPYSRMLQAKAVGKGTQLACKRCRQSFAKLDEKKKYSPFYNCC